MKANNLAILLFILVVFFPFIQVKAQDADIYLPSYYTPAQRMEWLKKHPEATLRALEKLQQEDEKKGLANPEYARERELMLKKEYEQAKRIQQQEQYQKGKN